MRPNTACAVLSLALAALVVAGCGGSDKAGGPRQSEPTVLTLANGNDESTNLAPFAAAVAKLSGGTLRIEFENAWRADETDFEAGVIQDVRAGKADLGWAGSRAFDDVDVPSFDALHAPLLIDSYPLQRKVLESGLVPAMLDGLERLDLVGIGILPGPLRKPLGVSRLLVPQDYVGTDIAFQRSQVAEQTLEALGAHGEEIPSAGSVAGFDGVEQHVGSIAGNRYDRNATYLAANVNLWPRPVVLFMNAKAFAGLDETQRDALRAAARAAVPATAELEQGGEEEAAAILCRRGVKFVTADAADLAALEAAVQPVYDRLERDAETKAAIEQVRAIRAAAASPPDAPACSGPEPELVASGVPTPIDGVYRSDVTLEQLRSAPGFEPGEDRPENVGRFRLELRNGSFRITGSSDKFDQAGAFAVKGDVLTFHWEASFSYRWSLDRGMLSLRKLGEGPPFFAVHPWRRVEAATAVGKRTPIDGVYLLTTTREEAAKAAGEPPHELVSENYGRWRFVLSRGLLRYTQASEGASRWTTATYRVDGDTLTVKVTDYGGEAPNDSAEKTGEVYTFGWSLYRDRLTLEPVTGKIAPANFRVKPWRRVGDAP